jgi:hypothetical protein
MSKQDSFVCLFASCWLHSLRAIRGAHLQCVCWGAFLFKAAVHTAPTAAPTMKIVHQPHLVAIGGSSKNAKALTRLMPLQLRSAYFLFIKGPFAFPPPLFFPPSSFSPFSFLPFSPSIIGITNMTPFRFYAGFRVFVYFCLFLEGRQARAVGVLF